MDRRSSLRSGAFAVALLFIATSAMAAGNYAFGPPAGWTRTHSGTTTKWADPTGAESLTLFPTEFGGDLNGFVVKALKKERASYPTQHVWTNRNYAICGGHTARYLIWTASSNGQSKVWEQMLALWGYDGYVVTYTRPEKNQPSNVARGSLFSICGVGSAPEQPGGVPVTTQNNAPPAPAPVAPSTDSAAPSSPNPSDTIGHPYMPVIPNP